MNDIVQRAGHVTSYLDDIQPKRSSEEDRSLDRVNLVNALKARARRSGDHHAQPLAFHSNLKTLLSISVQLLSNSRAR
jgi:hypothetical protein